MDKDQSPPVIVTFIDAVDEVVRNVFKDETAKVILKSLENPSSGTLPERLQIFTDALPKILGVGSVIIEDLILETLHSKLNLEFQWKKDYTFREYVMELANNP